MQTAVEAVEADEYDDLIAWQLLHTANARERKTTDHLDHHQHHHQHHQHHPAIKIAAGLPHARSTTLVVAVGCSAVQRANMTLAGASSSVKVGVCVFPSSGMATAWNVTASAAADAPATAADCSLWSVPDLNLMLARIPTTTSTTSNKSNTLYTNNDSDSSLYHEWIKALFASVQPDKVIVLATMNSSQYFVMGDEGHDNTVRSLRSIVTTNAVSINAFQGMNVGPLEPGNKVSGPASQVLIMCEALGIPGLLLVCIENEASPKSFQHPFVDKVLPPATTYPAADVSSLFPHSIHYI